MPKRLIKDKFKEKVGYELDNENLNKLNKEINQRIIGPIFFVIIMLITLIIFLAGISSEELTLDDNIKTVLIFLICLILGMTIFIPVKRNKIIDDFIVNYLKTNPPPAVTNIQPSPGVPNSLPPPAVTNIQPSSGVPNSQSLSVIREKANIYFEKLKELWKIPKYKAIILIIMIIIAAIPMFIIFIPKGPLVGTWQSLSSIRFYVKTDFDTWPNPPEDIGYEDREVTWKIRSNFDSYTIEFIFEITGLSITPGKGYTPPVSPEHFTGYLNENILTVYDSQGQVGQFVLQENTLIGTWDRSEEIIYTQVTYTFPNAFVLVKN